MVKNATYLPPAWLLVLIGLVLNIAAIVLTSVVLDKLGKETSLLADQKADNLYSIQLAWNSVETLERKREVLLLHLHLSQSEAVSEEMNQVLQGHLSAWTGEKVSAIEITQLSNLMSEINQAQTNYRNRIDSYYLENLEVTEVMSSLGEKIAWYKSIGLFLQVFGLALILARDLARKP